MPSAVPYENPDPPRSIPILRRAGKALTEGTQPLAFPVAAWAHSREVAFTVVPLLPYLLVQDGPIQPEILDGILVRNGVFRISERLQSYSEPCTASYGHLHMHGDSALRDLPLGCG